MTHPTQLYRPSLALMTDLYQLTMAYGYWKTGTAEDDAAFHLFFRRNPFKGGYAVACGLADAVDYLASLHFLPDDLSYLAEIRGNDGKPLFPADFLDYLGTLRFTASVAAIPEGTVVFAHEPLVRVTGPLLQCQIVETALLNLINFQTLIATKAARICRAAQGEPVIEFGLRRAQGPDGALSAARAAFVGGCAGTSNVLAGRLHGLPVKGTHAHSWVMSFDSELESFAAYADAMPNNCIFLVDTYDTLDGVRNAVRVGQQLRERGHELVGVRLDSGDLVALSRGARQILDEGGFPGAVIVASNDLDEYEVTAHKAAGGRVNVWGIGTRLVTAHDQPALGGVYKLTAIRGRDGAWDYRIKLSEQPVKVSNPGLQQVRRFYDAAGRALGDAIYDEERGLAEPACVVDVEDLSRRRTLRGVAGSEDLLVPVFERGQLVYEPSGLDVARARLKADLARFDDSVLRIDEPVSYTAGLDARLADIKADLMRAAAGQPTAREASP